MKDGLSENVSRETLEQLGAFQRLVEKWTSKINLVSKPSIPEIWERHILDSAQLHQMGSSSGHWVDLGSGGGFPAIVIAILSKTTAEARRFTLVESDQRKSAFLRTAIRELDLSATVKTARIEEIQPLKADVLSARALADLNALLGFAHLHMKPSGNALFLKGARWQEEVKSSQEMWRFQCTSTTSKTNSAAAILTIKDISRV